MSRWTSLVLALLFSLSLTAGGRAQSSVEAVFADIDAYWATVFAEVGIGYYSPLVAIVEGPVDTACGPIDPAFGPGAYCMLDETLYFAPAWFGDLNLAAENAAFVLVMSHEWAHHVQLLLGISDISILEPQADCLSGAYLENAEARDVVTPGDLAQALRILNSAGDVPWLEPGLFPHGPGTLRSIAFISGQSGDLADCGLVL